MVILWLLPWIIASGILVMIAVLLGLRILPYNSMEDKGIRHFNFFPYISWFKQPEFSYVNLGWLWFGITIYLNNRINETS